MSFYAEALLSIHLFDFNQNFIRFLSFKFIVFVTMLIMEYDFDLNDKSQIKHFHLFTIYYQMIFFKCFITMYYAISVYYLAKINYWARPACCMNFLNGK